MSARATVSAKRLRLIALVLTLMLFGGLAATACSGGSNTQATGSPTPAGVRDPAEPGPYAVGLTKMTFERTSNIDGKARTLETWIWYPAAATGDSAAPVTDAAPATDGGPFPIVVFSHGSGGQPNFYKYVTEHLASWGFVVVAPPHPGNTSADCSPCTGATLTTSARERPTDVAFVLDQVVALKDDPSQPLGTIIDPSRTALAGHSFGGWTSIFAGAGGSFDAIVSMATGLPELLLARAKTVRVPTLLLGGSKDELIAPASMAKLYAAMPADIAKTYVSFPEGRHLTFSDRCLGCTAALTEARGHELVNRYTTAFLETYVAGDARYAHYLTEDVAPDALIVHDAAAAGN